MAPQIALNLLLGTIMMLSLQQRVNNPLETAIVATRLGLQD